MLHHHAMVRANPAALRCHWGQWQASWAYLEIRSPLLPAACECVYTEILLARCLGRRRCLRAGAGMSAGGKGKGQSPSCASAWTQALLPQAAMQLALCPGPCAPTHPMGPFRWEASPEQSEPLLLSPRVAGDGGMPDTTGAKTCLCTVGCQGRVSGAGMEISGH